MTGADGVLVLRPGALGDTLLAVPALRALRQRFGHVTLAGHAAAGRLLRACGEVDAAIAFDDPALAWAFRGEPAPRATIAWMSAPVVNGALVQAPSRPTALVQAPSRPTALVQAPSRRTPREEAPSRPNPREETPSRPTAREHCAAYLLRTVAGLGCNQAIDASPVRMQPVQTGEVLVHPGSGSAAKNWPAERFAAVIAALDAPVRLVVGEADRSAASNVEQCLGRALPRLESDLPELAARLAGCRGYLGNDSGVSHLAGCCGARGVVLFGPTDPCVWRPLGQGVHVLPFDAPVAEVVSALAGSWCAGVAG